MRGMFVAVLTVLTAPLVTGCGAPAASAPPFRPVADVKQLMNHVLDPAADLVWGSVGTIVTAEGTEERYPRSEEEWMEVLHGAYAIAESGNLLMMEGRRQDNAEWTRLSQALIDVGVKTIQAAEAQDKDAVFRVGGEIYAVCNNCHQKYSPEIARDL